MVVLTRPRGPILCESQLGALRIYGTYNLNTTWDSKPFYIYKHPWMLLGTTLHHIKHITFKLYQFPYLPIFLIAHGNSTFFGGSANSQIRQVYVMLIYHYYPHFVGLSSNPKLFCWSILYLYMYVYVSTIRGNVCSQQWPIYAVNYAMFPNVQLYRINSCTQPKS